MQGCGFLMLQSEVQMNLSNAETVAPDIQHPFLRSDFEWPVIPKGCDSIVAIKYPDATWGLEFYCSRTRSVAYDIELTRPISWPWLEDYKPTHADWTLIGMLPLYS
jgi:hypothetical protein